MVDHPVRFRYQLNWIVTGCLLLCASSLLADPPAKTKLTVSSFAFDALPLTPPTTKELATQLSATPWCTAIPADTKGAWNKVPDGVDPKQWVSVVTVGFKGQADAYACMFNGPQGAISMVTHVPFREVWVAEGALGWVWPVDNVLGSLRVSDLEPQEKPQRRLLHLNVVKWDDVDGNAPAAKPTNLDDAQTLSPEQVLPAVNVMTHAAAFEAGWAPAATESAGKPVDGQESCVGVCEVKVEDQACSFRLKVRIGDREHVFTKLHVPWETYHDHLVRLFRYVETTSGVSDFTQLARLPVELLGIHDGRLACLVNHELTVFDLTTGKKAWTTEPAVKPANYLPAPQYTLLRKDKGGPRLIRYRPSLAEFNWDAGKITALAPSAADVQHRLSTNATADFATSNAGTVAFHRQGKPVWEQKEPDGVSAGPLVNGKDVVYGQTTGRLVARSAQDAKVTWQSRLPGSLYGQIIPAGETLLVFSNSAEALLAIDPAKGTERWKCAVGDVLLEAPLVVGKQVLIVTKGKRIALIDLATGKIQKENNWPTWFGSVKLLSTQPAPLIAATDLSGQVSLLSLTDLQPKREFQLETQLSGQVLYAEKLSYKWPVAQAAESEENLLAEIKDGPTQAGPALLAADIQGFLYILPLSSPE